MTFLWTTPPRVEAPSGHVLGDALDEMCDSYVDWRDETRAAARAYRRWCGAPLTARRQSFAAYVAALDREAAAAARYARATRDVAVQVGRG